MFRFLHSSDLHVGRSFGGFDPELAARLREARFGIVDQLAEHAREASAPVIMLAGDIWDTEVPSEAVLRQSLDAMARCSDLTWMLLPGNHDLVGPGGLWERVASAGIPNVCPLIEEAPFQVDADVWLLPSPCRSKNPGRDVTAWMDGAETPEGALRIGIAHGPVASFGEDSSTSIIDPQRAEKAGLDYLALGDWHGWVEVGQRTIYPGTPEPDRFRDNAGACALVSITASGAVPEVVRTPTGRFNWQTVEIDTGFADDPEAALAARMPEDTKARDVLLSLTLTGTLALSGQVKWQRALDHLAPSLAHLDVDRTQLTTAVQADDLERIDHLGALREAAETLRIASTDETASTADREAADLALTLLFSWSLAVEDSK